MHVTWNTRGSWELSGPSQSCGPQRKGGWERRIISRSNVSATICNLVALRICAWSHWESIVSSGDEVRVFDLETFGCLWWAAWIWLSWTGRSLQGLVETWSTGNHSGSTEWGEFPGREFKSHDDEAEDRAALSALGAQEAFRSWSIYKALYFVMASISFRDNYGGFQLGKNEGHIEFHLPPGKSGTWHDRKVDLLMTTSPQSDRKPRLALYQLSHSRAIRNLSLATRCSIRFMRKPRCQGEGRESRW